jgi:hypothetical protein
MPTHSTGTLKNATFSGTLRHHDGNRPVSVIRGVVGLDSRRDTLGVFADVQADSLALDGLTGRIQNFPLRGSLAGTIRLEGDLAGLETHANLAMLNGGGAVRGDGTLVLGVPSTQPVYGVRKFTLHAQDMNLQRWMVHGGPPTRLTFRDNIVGGDSVSPPVGAFSAASGPRSLRDRSSTARRHAAVCRSATVSRLIAVAAARPAHPWQRLAGLAPARPWNAGAQL